MKFESMAQAGEQSLEAYRQASARWFEWLDGDPQHSIAGQLSQLLWHDVVFRALNHARSVAPKNEPSAALSPYLATFLDQGYVAGQVLGVSKLVERHHGDANKGVISLRRLVDELIASREILTRANFIEHDGYPYDFEPVMQADIDRNMRDAAEGVAFWAMETGGALDWGTAQRLHETFDRLSGVSAANRARDDLVAKETLQRLAAVFDDPVFKVFQTVRHKTVAHAADAFSRALAVEIRTGIKFEEVERAHRLLLGVAQVISASILHGSWRAGAVPQPQQDQFANLDQPYVGAAQIGELHEFWKGLTEVRDDWLREAWEELMPPAPEA